MQGWRGCVLYAILKKKSYNFTTSMLKAYFSAHPFSLSAFMINKIYVYSFPRASQKTAKHKKCVVAKVLF